MPNGVNNENSLLDIQHNTTNSPRRLEEEETLGGSKCSNYFGRGSGNDRREGRTSNPISTEHGDITAAVSAIFASANANSWPIGKHHAYGVGSISQ